MLDQTVAPVSSSAVVTALGPAFAAGFAVQQLLEIADPVIALLGLSATAKKAFLGLLSLVIGLAIAYVCGLRVLQALGSSSTEVHGDLFITGVVISAGTEGFNSIMKFLGYSKDAKKAAAAQQVAAAGKPALAAING